MSTATGQRHKAITISDADRKVDYVLVVNYDRLPPEPEVGYAGGVEVNSVRCVEIVTWCGEYGTSAYPGHDPMACLEKKIGEWCREKYLTEIEERLEQ